MLGSDCNLMMEYKIRPALVEDCKFIYGLMRQLVEFRNYTLKPKLEDFIENGFGDGHPPYFHVLVVEKTANKSIVAYLLYYHSYSSCEGKSLFIENIYVDPNHRGKGIASALVGFLCRFAVENGFVRIESLVYKLNEPSIKLHQAFGAVDLHETHYLLPYRIDSEGIRKAAEEQPKFI
ncbi:thialysine N-epsilon-acetyltransferase-like [Brevipalpus obovatus]|uniref:thialysine N-epsilon-acetyltransferase-like n=1 Tax=Brevipalpus obovatus TaxID=246614 RepID=UPI003D9EC7B4